MRRTVLLKILSVLPLVAVCRGNLEIWAVNPHESICAGGTVSFEVVVTGAEAEFVTEWANADGQFVDDSEHFSLNENKTVLTISNALPPHAGFYFAAVKYVTENDFNTFETFQLEVQDLQLHTLVKSPVKVELGDKGILKVNKSEEGELFWIHNGNVIQGSQDSKYAFVDTQGSTRGTKLEISVATAMQGGLYEVVLIKGGCQVRNIIDVQVQDIVEDTEAAHTEDPKFWGMVDHKYLGFFSGDFSGEWYIAPLVLGPVIILLLVLVVCIIRRSRSRKRSKKDEGEVEVTHVVFEEPIYSVQDQVFYPPADPTYDIASVTSSHPQSSSLHLDTYGDVSIYGMDNGAMSTYDTLLGPSVPPPTSEQTSSGMSDLEDFSDD